MRTSHRRLQIRPWIELRCARCSMAASLSVSTSMSQREEVAARSLARASGKRPKNAANPNMKLRMVPGVRPPFASTPSQYSALMASVKKYMPKDSMAVVSPSSPGPNAADSLSIGSRSASTDAATSSHARSSRASSPSAAGS